MWAGWCVQSLLSVRKLRVSPRSHTERWFCPHSKFHYRECGCHWWIMKAIAWSSVFKAKLRSISAQLVEFNPSPHPLIPNKQSTSLLEVYVCHQVCNYVCPECTWSIEWSDHFQWGIVKVQWRVPNFLGGSKKCFSEKAIKLPDSECSLQVCTVWLIIHCVTWKLSQPVITNY